MPPVTWKLPSNPRTYRRADLHRIGELPKSENLDAEQDIIAAHMAIMTAAFQVLVYCKKWRSRVAFGFLTGFVFGLTNELSCLRRKSPKRPSFGMLDRLVLVGLYRLAPKVLDVDVLAIVNPETEGEARTFEEAKKLFRHDFKKSGLSPGQFEESLIYKRAAASGRSQ